jgi:hypothetical protein
VRIYNPHLRKLDSRTISGIYKLCSKLKEFSFYCPSFNHRIVESRNAKFLEDVELSGSAYPQRIKLEEARELTGAPSYEGCLIVLRENQID